MKIAFYDDRYHMVYGAQENLLLLAEWNAAAGHEVSVMTAGEGPFAVSARARGLEVQVVEGPASLMQFDRGPVWGSMFQRARGLLAAVRYNLTVSRALAGSGADLAVAGTPRAAMWLVLSAVLRRPPMLLWVQGEERRQFMGLIAGMSAWRIGLIGDRCRNLFAPRVRRRVEARFRPLPSGRDLCEFQDIPRVSRPDGGPVRLLSIGSITQRKGFDLLLDALADLDDRKVSLTIVGSTTNAIGERHLAQLRRQAARYRLDVDFVGWHDDVRPFLEAAEVFVLASRSEGLPGVLLEAMASGLPCVTTRSGDSGPMVEQCGAGLAVDVDDVEALSAAISTMVTDPDARRRFGEAGRRSVELRYTPEVCLAGFDAIVAELGRRR